MQLTEDLVGLAEAEGKRVEGHEFAVRLGSFLPHLGRLVGVVDVYRRIVFDAIDFKRYFHKSRCTDEPEQACETVIEEEERKEQ